MPRCFPSSPAVPTASSLFAAILIVVQQVRCDPTDTDRYHPARLPDEIALRVQTLLAKLCRRMGCFSALRSWSASLGTDVSGLLDAQKSKS
jgi:hypothetical protein